VLVGFTGLVLLVTAGKDVRFSNMGYATLIIFATICYGLNVNMVSRHLKHIPSLMLASFAFGMLIIPSGLILLFTGYTQQTAIEGFWYSTGASAVLGIFGTAVASVLFYMLMKRAGPLFASMVTYGIPFVALFWGSLAGETITMVQIACLGIILVGVYLANKPR
jgi:drug/metabolite transporter (DMT)-like permease